jgi:release factor glutamine methyltransferase
MKSSQNARGVLKTDCLSSENRTPQSAASTLREIINKAAAKLHAAGIASARFDTEILLSHVANKDRAWLITHMYDTLTDETTEAFESAVRRRIQREPLQYIVGKQEFWALDFVVTPDVLIPRPETELAVEWALAVVGPTNKHVTIVDLCTGSGCIAVSLARALGKSRIFATDKSAKAISVARINASNHGVSDRVLFLEGDLFQPLESLDIRSGVDIIVSNPPYVPSGDYHTLQPEVRDYEPAMALIAGPQGIEMHEKILKAAPDYLKPRGTLIMEMGLGQANMLVEIMRASDAYTTPAVHRDLAGIERVVIARKA